MDLKRSINQHDVRELTDWLVNILVQPQTGEGAVTPEKHFQMNLQEIRDALIGVEQVVNNLSTMTEGKVLDARQGKALKDMINLMNLNTVIEWQEQVLDSELPVAGELVGDRYLDLNVSDKIMTWTGSEFTAETPEENWAVFVRRTLVIYVYTGDQVWRVLGDFGIFLDTFEQYVDQELLTDSDVKHNSIDVQDLLLPGGVLTAAQLNSAGFHNSVFRGKVHPYPGFTVEQMAGIKNGTFYDLFPGDVITGPVTNIEYLVAHCNYKLRAGDTAVTENHVSLIPKGTLFTKYMNSTSTTTGGYKGSSMYTDIDGLPKALADFIELDFPGLVLSYREYVSTAIDSGSWGTRKCDLLSEVAAYGGIVNSSPGSNGLFHVGVDKSQLAVFSLRPDLLNIRTAWWLRGVSTSTYFCSVTSDGLASRDNASDARGVRPLFHIYNPAP